MTPRNVLLVLIGLVAGALVSVQIPLYAQRPAPDVEPGAAPSRPSLQDALYRPYDFAFAEPTPLDEVARRLSEDLGGQVVLDVAALQRLNLDKEETVELELKGSRLKTGLKLLLDQVGLTYRIVPEDNLMILTDPDGAEDPVARMKAELGEMHQELHDVQDTLDELLDLFEFAEGGPRLRQPTIIEEMPADPGPDPADPGIDPVPNDEEPAPVEPRRPRTSI